MNIKKLPFLLIFIVITMVPLQSRAAFVLNGQGTVLDLSDICVPSESVEFTFSYDLSDFTNNIFSPDVAIYNAITPIPVKITGSISGQFSRIDPVSRVVVYDNLSGTGRDKWEFNVTGGVSTSAGLTATNLSGDEFNRPLPDTFAEAHSIFFPQHTDPLIWTQNNNAILLANNGEDELWLTDVQWAVVPVPAAIWLFGSGLIGLIGVARRKSRV
jgi:hypothetical protein